MTPIHQPDSQPIYFFPSDSNSSPSGSGGSSSGDAARRGSSGGSDKESRPKTTTNQNTPLAVVSPVTPLTSGGGSYFDASHSRQHRSHQQQQQHNQAPIPTHAHPRSFAHLLLSSTGDGQQNFSRASSITSLGSGSESEDEDEEDGVDDHSEDAAETYATDEYFPPLAVEWATQTETPPARADRSKIHRPIEAPSASATSRASRLPTGTSSSSRAMTGPPRLSHLFDSTTIWPQARTSTGPYADAIIDNPAESSPLAPARKRQRLRYCPERNCCGNALSHPGKKASSSSTGKEEEGEEEGEARVKELFWKRQLWLMEHRGADGLSRCGSEERQTSEQAGGEAPGVAASHDQVLRTAGAGLPLARVKRVMKSADDEIKVSEHAHRPSVKSYSISC